MKAYLINPFEKTVTVVDYNGKLEQLYELMGCTMVSAPVEFDNMDTMFADDEGLFNPENSKGSFMMKDWSYPIVGKILVVGCDEEGNSVDVKTPIEFFEKEAIWVDEIKTTQWMNQYN